MYLHPNAIVNGRRLRHSFFTLEVPSDTKESLEDRIRRAEAKRGIPPGQGVSIVYRRPPFDFGKLIVIGIIAAVAYWIYKNRNFSIMSSGSLNPFRQMTQADFTLIDPKEPGMAKRGVKLSDVAGLKQAKIEVQEFVDYLQNSDKYQELGAKPPKGAIMFGPPGCGKTMLAKAVANESSVPFLSMNGSEFTELIGGVGAARVRSLFEEARKRKPSIIYIDEIDAIGRKRGGGSGAESGGAQEMEQTLNQLLVEMDGLMWKEGVILLASTNRQDVLDKALLRPGRFDRHIEIDLPNVVERKEILEQHMNGVALDDEVSVLLIGNMNHLLRYLYIIGHSLL